MKGYALVTLANIASKLPTSHDRLLSHLEGILHTVTLAADTTNTLSSIPHQGLSTLKGPLVSSTGATSTVPDADKPLSMHVTINEANNGKNTGRPRHRRFVTARQRSSRTLQVTEADLSRPDANFCAERAAAAMTAGITLLQNLACSECAARTLLDSPLFLPFLQKAQHAVLAAGITGAVHKIPDTANLPARNMSDASTIHGEEHVCKASMMPLQDALVGLFTNIAGCFHKSSGDWEAGQHLNLLLYKALDATVPAAEAGEAFITLKASLVSMRDVADAIDKITLSVMDDSRPVLLMCASPEIHV